MTRAWPTAAQALLVGAVAVAATSVMVAAGLAASTPVRREPVLLGALLFAIGSVSLITLRFGRTGHAYSVAEVALVLTLPLLSWPWLVLAAVASALPHLAARRTPRKLAFNVAVSVGGTAVAAATAVAVAGGRPALDTPRGALAGGVAGVVFGLWSAGFVVAMILLTTERPWRDVLGSQWLAAVVAVGNTGLAIWAVDIVARDPLALAVLPPLLLALYGAYRGYVAASTDRDRWRQLERAAKELHQLDADRVIQVAADRGLALFGADAVEVRIGGRRAGDPDVVHRRGLGGAAPYDVSGTTVATGEVVLDRLDGHRGWRVGAPLPELGGLHGDIRLWFLRRQHPPMPELRVLRTYAHTISTTLLTAELYHEVSDLARRKSYEADHDALTSLANRSLFLRRAAQALEGAPAGRTVAVVVFDIDHFKHVNDTLGHAAGDALLAAVAGRLPALLRSRDTVARFGGDEFALVLTDLATPEDAELVVGEVLRAVSEPVSLGDATLSVQASAGIACYPDDGVEVAALVQHADVALYAAKRQRGSARRYDAASSRADGLTPLSVGAELRRALDRGEFELHYQPQIDLATGVVVGCEGLVRWLHPTRGLLPPADFVAIAEHCGFVGDFTAYVLDRAVAECARWPAVAGRELTVAVNLSARNLIDRRFAAMVSETLARHGLAPERLVVELTETTAPSDLHLLDEVLGTLREAGVRLAVDDFGTGYSSLTFLQRVAVHELKIDRTFVAALLHDAQAEAMVRATIDLAQSLGLRSVAEGIESAEVAERLRLLGCERGQGFHFAPPAPADRLDAVLRRLEPVA